MKKGFTLIELLVVIAIIAIIGILSAVVLTSLNGAKAKARKSAALSTMRALVPEIISCQTDGGIVCGGAAINQGANVCVASGNATPCTTTATNASGHTVTWPNVAQYGFAYNTPSGDNALLATNYVFSANNATYGNVVCNMTTPACTSS